MAVDPKALAAKIREMYPEIGTYKLKMDVSFDPATQAWLVKLTKDAHELLTHVEQKDAEDCLKGVKCVCLTHQIGQFIRVYCEGGEGSCAV